MPHPHRPRPLLRRYSRPAVDHRLPRWRFPAVDVRAGTPDPYRTWPPARRRGRANSHPAVVLPIVVGIMATAANAFFPIGLFAFGFAFIALRTRLRRRKRAKQQVAQAARGVRRGDRRLQQAPRQAAPPAIDPDSLEGLRDALKEQKNERGAAEAARLIALRDRLNLAPDAGGVSVPDELKTPIKSLLTAGKGMLRKAVKLGAVAPQLSTLEAQEEMGALMDELLIDLAETHGELAHALDQLQLREVRNDRPEREIDRLRRELDEQLNVARRVDERLDILDDEIQPDAHERAADGW